MIAVAITSQPQQAGFPLTLELKESMVSKQSWVKISQIRTLSVKRIGNKLAKVSAVSENTERLYGKLD